MRALAAATLFLSISLAGAPPRLDLVFENGTVVLRGGGPGARTAWMALVRERVGSHTAVRVERGIAVAGPEGKANVDHPAAKAARAVWMVAGVDGGGVGRGAPAGYGMSERPLTIHATAGTDVIAVEASEARVLFVSPPAGAWAYDAADGSAMDHDGVRDGRVTIPLSALRALQGQRPAPKHLSAADVVLAIDPNRMRTGEVVVP